ncbi:isochorismatase family protein [Streptomyces sp. DSM 42041]|uniref:Isochorismatase family protein n=1 Tax=Streptomyces hazeniae TaxID=3075538 RepID=A0ABU2NQG4_9ACTN|nr:isochorismatase family protein [Streptomyces sp. DSM 42041]MDT0377853.1 isochorismatase family protein [Streptomyces sp. DSM 42041]
MTDPTAQPGAAPAPWTNGGAGVIDDTTLRRYESAGFGRPTGLGSRPALLVIDVQYRTVGTTPQPFEEAVKEFPTSCGETGWAAVGNIVALLGAFRENHWPVLYPHVAPKKDFDAGRLGAKVPGIMHVPARGYDFVAEVAPADGDVLVPKRHPSAFFGTPLTSYLIEAGVDTLVVTGCTTSGCVRASVTDAFSLNFHVAVPSDAVYDRSPVVHEANLFDMAQKYADVSTTAELVPRLTELRAARRTR